MLIRKERPSPRRFSRISENVRRHFVQISYAEFHSNGTIIVKSGVENDLRPKVKYGFHCTDVHGTQHR
jgi:hypothetical protein